MEKHILIQYKSLKEELPELERKIDKITSSQQKLGREEVSDVVSCGRRGKKPLRTVKIEGTPTREQKIYGERLARRRREYERLKKRIEEMTEEAEAYINAIEDSETRRVMRCRYLSDLTWRETAQAMGEGYTEDMCRKKAERASKLPEGKAK